VKKYILQEEQNIQVPRFEESAGFYTTLKRSMIMSKIKNKNTAPELKLKKALWAAGVRYKKSKYKILGNPDVQLLKYKILIFIDGDFWHGYDWEHRCQKIVTNRNFWIPKIERNIQRDRQVTLALERQGYKVIRFWEHEIKSEFGRCLLYLLNEINHKRDHLMYLK
jgi:DNA mismatch endonuclease, patch repair protein